MDRKVTDCNQARPETHPVWGTASRAFFFHECGRRDGAQVIIEGREMQSDGGEKDKDNPTTKNNRQPQPKGRVSTIL